MTAPAENGSLPSAPPAGQAGGAQRSARLGIGVWAAVAIMVLCAGYILGFQNRYVKTLKTNRIYQGVLYSARDGQRLIPLSMGYRLPFSDFLFIRSIQSFGGMFRGARNYRSLFNLFFVMTDLDPKFIDAYKFGNLVMGDEGGDQESGIALMDKGMLMNREKYRLPYEATYCLMYQMPETDANKQRALFYVNMALKSKDAPDWLPRVRDEILMKKGKYRLAARMSLQGYLEALDQRQPVLIGVYSRRLLASIHRWQLDSLLQEAISFKKLHGRDIKSVRELFESNPQFIYEGIDVQRLRQIIAFYEANGKKLTPDFEKILQQITVPTHEPPYDVRIMDDPKRPNDRPPYIVMHGYNSGDRFNFIQSEEDVVDYLNKYLGQVRLMLQEYWKREKKLPARFEDVLPGGMVVMREPFGGTWIYEPGLMAGNEKTFINAVFRSSIHPEI